MADIALEKALRPHAVTLKSDLANHAGLNKDQIAKTTELIISFLDGALTTAWNTKVEDPKHGTVNVTWLNPVLDTVRGLLRTQ